MSGTSGIFKQIEEHTYTKDKCFLCGCELDDKNRTKEHVIPKWLIKKFNLWNEQMTLLNGSLLAYRFLTIPCCKKCNGVHLSPFEDNIKRALEGGFEEFRKIDKTILLLWLGKIYFGILYLELFLNLDRKEPEKGTITNPEYVRAFYSLLLFLQGIRGIHKFENCFPASIFLFETQKPAKIENQWDFKDNQHLVFISIRMGDVGIISALQDGETIKQMEDLLEHHKDIAFHPLQFDEMTAKILYKLSLMKVTPTFINRQTEYDSVTSMMPLLQTEDIFEDWNNNDYMHLVSHIMHIPIDVCQPVKGQVYTWLNDVTGKSTFMKMKE